MSEKINWAISAQIVGGPQLLASSQPPLEVDAYDKIDVTIPAGTNAEPGTATIEVQPGASGQVQFLMLTASLYSENGKLTYTVDQSKPIELDAPLLLVGNGAVKLLGTTQKSFVFTNQMGADKSISIKILVGRDATPTAPTSSLPNP